MPYESLQILFLIFCIVLVFLMQVGFLCLEAGAVRSKNSINVATKNLLDLIVATIVYIFLGFYIQYGSFNNLLSGAPENSQGYLQLFLILQALFAATTATIVSGAVAERCGLKGYLVIGMLITIFIYPIAGQWVWGGALGTETGWLARLGFVDLAGSTVVHSIGGSVALAALLIIGPRRDVYEQDSGFKGQNYVISLMGVMLLWFGWFGFNMGSLLRVGPQLPVVLVNTFIAGAAGGFAGICWSYLTHKRAELPLIANGVLAGLVSITAGAHALSPEASMFTGFVGGCVCAASMALMNYLRLDDVIGAVPVHLAAGIWGTLAVGLLGNPEILNTGNDYLTQLGVQALGIVTVFIWSFGTGYILLRIFNRFMPLRVSEEDELVGLNVAEHGTVSEMSELVSQLEVQIGSGRFQTVSVDPFSELYAIARQYNAILERFLQSQSHMKQNIQELEETRDQLQDQKEVTEKANQYKSDFLAKVSHDMRTPLNSIVEFSELLNDEELNEEQKEYTRTILQSGQTLLAVINDVLDFSEIDSGKVSLESAPYDLEKLLEQCKALFIAETLERPVELELDVQLSMPRQLLGDRGKIRQVIINLLGNAFKFTEKGSIKVSARYDYMKEQVFIEVSDTGKGIHSESLDSIFESFEQEDNSAQREYGGTGLGLAISKQLIELMGGKIGVKSQLGKGSTFYFYIKNPSAEDRRII